MFSLIITVISIALVVALVAATMYSGGETISEGKVHAQAARIITQSQQLLAASELFLAHTGMYPNSVEELISTGYLNSMPMASIVPAVHAEVASWRMPVSNVPVFELSRAIDIDVCRQVNARGTLNLDGVALLPYEELRIQCYGNDADALTVVISKDRTQLSRAVAGGVEAGFPSVANQSAWLLLPESHTPGQPGYEEPELPVTTEPDEENAIVVLRYQIGGGEVGGFIDFGTLPAGGNTTIGLRLANEGDGNVTIVSAPRTSGDINFAIQGTTCAAGQVLTPNASCNFAVMATNGGLGTQLGMLHYELSGAEEGRHGLQALGL